MAKRKLTATQKLRGLVQKQIRRMEKRGYRVDSALKEKVKTGKYQTLKSIQKDKYRKLYEASTAESEGKIVSGSRKRLIERKEAAEKAIRTRQRKPKPSDIVWKEAPSITELEDELYDNSKRPLTPDEFERMIKANKDARDILAARDIQEGKVMYQNIEELIDRFKDKRHGANILEDALASEIEKYGRNAVMEAMANTPGDVIAEAQNIAFYKGTKEEKHRAIVHFFDSIIGEVRTLEADKALGEALDRQTDFYVP